MSVARQIVGPQAKYERTGAQSLRDIRPFTTRLSEALRGSASFLVLSGAAVATWFAPALIDLTVPASCLYATWVLTRRPSLPIRLPRSARVSRPRKPSARQPQGAARARRHFHRLVDRRAGALDHRRGRASAHDDPGHDRRRQNDGDPEPSGERTGAGFRVRAGGRQGRSYPVWQGAGAGPPGSAARTTSAC